MGNLKRHRILILVGFTACCLILWWALQPKSTPEGVASNLAKALIEGDLNWIYDHATPTEREILTLRHMEAYHAEFVADAFRGAKIIGLQRHHQTANKCSIVVTIDSPSKGKIEFVVIGFVEEGREVVGALETLFSASIGVLAAENKITKHRYSEVLAAHGPWLRAHGIEKWYSVQDDSVLPL